LIPGRRLEVLAENTDRIFLSFISPRPEVQDWFMRGVKVEKVKNNLKTLAASRHPPELVMNVLVMRENAGHLSEVLSFAS
jgi:MoaA/NifB/PqqE/SkfB family radical SAM enzyme